MPCQIFYVVLLGASLRICKNSCYFAVFTYPGALLMALSKDQLINEIAEATNSTKTHIRDVLDQLSQVVNDALDNDGEITLPGIGKLKVTERPARTGRNPQTGAAIDIAAKKVIKLVPAKALVDSINS